MRHEVEVIDEYSVFSVVPARSAAGWLAGLTGSSHPPSSPHDLLQPGALCKRRDLLWPPLLPGFGSLVQILRSSSAQHTHPLYTNGQAAHAYTRTHTHADAYTRTASIVAPLRKPKPELSPHLLLISSRRFCIRKSSREPRVIKENEGRAASFFNCDCDH